MVLKRYWLGFESVGLAEVETNSQVERIAAAASTAAAAGFFDPIRATAVGYTKVLAGS